jgi:polyisoprenoid-binding protein YceI
MVKIRWVFFCFFWSIQMATAQMHPVAKGSSIVFTIHNFGFKTGGTLAAPQGDILFNPDDLSKASFQITIQAESINTDNESRDEHLKEEDYFDVKKYPEIRFVSNSVHATDKQGNFQADGSLTVKGISKMISLPFKAVKNSSGYRFTGSFKMNRRDFNIGGSSTISNELTVDIIVVAE